MSIRWKLLLLLLVIGLAPLLASTLLGNRSMYRLGHEMSDQALDSLTQRAKRQLRLFVKAQALLLGKEGKQTELALRLQAREVERHLAGALPADPHIYFASDYDDPKRAPKGMVFDDRYIRFTTEGGESQIPISLEHQVFKLAPSVDEEAVSDDVTNLGPMRMLYRDLYENYLEASYWHYTSLETGAHSCYPGHGGYPPAYDPRERDWYKDVKARGEGIYWTPPYIEVSTRQAVLTAAMPVHHPDGTFAGATAIDLTVSSVVELGKLPASANAEAKMVVLVPREVIESGSSRPLHAIDKSKYLDQPEKLGLLILAQPAEDYTDMRWESPYQLEWLASKDSEQFLAMVRDMATGQAGVREMSHRGRPSLWAYGPAWKGGGYLVIIAPYDEVMAEAVRAKQTVLAVFYHQLWLRMVILVVAAGVIVLLALVGSRAVTEPVRRLVEAAMRVAQGDFSARVHVVRHDELGQLGHTFNAMVPQLEDRMQLRHSLSLAMDVQQHLLPAGPPTIEGLDIAGTSVYCDETGGDYYDFLDLSEINPHELGVAVGDVTGHGVAAALLMTGARALLRSHADYAGTLAELMQKINYHLVADTTGGRFMTLLYMVINTRDRSLRWANAGHDSPLIYDPKDDAFIELEGAQIPLGIERDWAYEEFRHDGLRPGQVIVIGTDGIWETRNPRSDLYGKEALKAAIRNHARSSAVDISHAINRELVTFRQGAPQQDDVTLVVIRITA